MHMLAILLVLCLFACYLLTYPATLIATSYNKVVNME